MVSLEAAGLRINGSPRASRAAKEKRPAFWRNAGTAAERQKPKGRGLIGSHPHAALLLCHRVVPLRMRS